MDVNWILMAIASLLVVSLCLVRQRGIVPKTKRHESLSPLVEVIKTAEVANDGFFRSLELVQKNLESLIARAETMEQRLRSLTLHSGLEKREQYTAAALLLAEGQEVERVASMLNLPVGQVHLIRDLQQVMTRDKRTPVRGERSENLLPQDGTRQSKNAVPREKIASRPILLVDAIKNAVRETTARDNERARFEVATV
jgi:hypothetical protein